MHTFANVLSETWLKLVFSSILMIYLVNKFSELLLISCSWSTKELCWLIFVHWKSYCIFIVHVFRKVFFYSKVVCILFRVYWVAVQLEVCFLFIKKQEFYWCFQEEQNQLQGSRISSHYWRESWTQSLVWCIGNKTQAFPLRGSLSPLPSHELLTSN